MTKKQKIMVAGGVGAAALLWWYFRSRKSAPAMIPMQVKTMAPAATGGIGYGSLGGPSNHTLSRPTLAVHSLSSKGYGSLS